MNHEPECPIAKGFYHCWCVELTSAYKRGLDDNERYWKDKQEEEYDQEETN